MLSPGIRNEPLIYEDISVHNTLLNIVDKDPEVRVDAAVMEDLAGEDRTH